MLDRQEEYEKMATVEEQLWWYRILHEKVLASIRKNFSSKTIRILDVGCGTGGLLLFLKKNGYPNCKGIDLSEYALKYASQRGLNVRQGSIAELSGNFPGETFDVIISNDVLYFFNPEEFDVIFRDWNKVLSPGGLIILNLPALNAFRGMHDVSVGIKYRIAFSQFERSLPCTDLKISQAYYWPFFLSPLIYLMRLQQRLRMRKTDVKIQSDVSLPSRLANQFFYLITKVESLVPGKKWGSSLFLLLRKDV